MRKLLVFRPLWSSDLWVRGCGFVSSFPTLEVRLIWETGSTIPALLKTVPLIFDQIKQTLVQNVASLFLGSQVVLLGGERGMPFVVGDVGELERCKTKSWKSLWVCPPSSQGQARFPGAGAMPRPPTTTTFIIPLDLRHPRYPRMALFPWRVSQKWRSSLAKKGLLHCKEKYTPTVNFFSFNPTIL